MASVVNGIIEQIKIASNNTTYAIAASAYGVCDTPSNESIKNVEMTGFKLIKGVTIHIKFSNSNEAENPKLKFNGDNDNAKFICQQDGTHAGTDPLTTGWPAGAVLTLTYDGNNWIRGDFNSNTIYTVASGTENGKIKIESSAGQNYEVGVYGLGSAAYTSSTNYVPNAEETRDVDELYNTGIYNITSDSILHGPTTYKKGQLLVMSYRNHTNNTKPDYAIQLYGHYGRDGDNGNALYYRTSSLDTWQNWQKIIHVDAKSPSIGGTRTPIYIDASGEIVAGETIKDHAYGDVVTTVNGSAGDVSITAESLGLSKALNFIGITTTQLQEGATTSSLAGNNLKKTTNFSDGDVVMDSEQLREYVWIDGKWHLLGISLSTKYERNTDNNKNIFISSITQRTDGTITAETKELITTGEWLGNAVTATTADSAKALANLYNRSSRPTDANITHATNGGVTHFKATGSMKSNKPEGPYGDGNILHFHWDSSDAWDSQLFIPVRDEDHMQYRAKVTKSTWENWQTLLDSTNYSSYAVKAITSTDNVIPRFDGTTGQIQSSRMSIDDDGVISLSHATRYPGWVRLYNKAGIQVAQYWYDIGKDTDRTGIFRWREYSPDASDPTVLTEHYETYSLPEVNENLNDNKSYNILTTKDMNFNIGGNAATATKLKDAHSIWGHSFDGTADISGHFTMKNTSSRYHYFYIKQNNTDNTVGHIMYDSGNFTNVTTGRWCFAAYSPNSTNDTSTTGFAEIYYLPTVAKGLNANQPYNILTTKDMGFDITGNAATATLATKATGDSDGNAINTTYAKLSGADFTGAVWATKDSGTIYVGNYRTDTGLQVCVHINSGSTNHGIYSNGYYNGTSFTSDGAWLIYRNNRGITTVNGNCTGSSGSCTGNAATAAKWENARTITLTGSVTGYIPIDGSSDVILNTTTNHNHDDRYIKITGGTMVGTDTETTTEQWVTLTMGNKKAEGTAGNYSGRIRLYSNLAYYQELRSARANLTANRIVNLPAKNENCTLVDTTGTGASGSWNINSATASKLTDITSSDKASSTATWRRIWFSYNDNATGRPAYSEDFAYQTSTNTIKVGRISTSDVSTMTRTTAGNFINFLQNSASCGCLRLDTLGSADAEGWADLLLGNNKKSNATNNASGRIYLYNSNGTGIAMTAKYGALATISRSYIDIDNWLNASGVTGAVWNDYAEFRKTNKKAKAGQAVIDNDDGSLSITDKRLMPGAQIVSDTFGFSIGETEEAKTPLAVSGRVLAYTYRPREEYHAGMAVCSAPNGTIDIMTREEIQQYPDAIIGIVSEIPEYEEWGTGKVKVNKRIWIKIK